MKGKSIGLWLISLGLATGFSMMEEPPQPPVGFTGAPGEGTCRNCHEGSVGGTLRLLWADGQPVRSYIPGGPPQPLILRITYPSAQWYGFQATILPEVGDDTLVATGLIAPSDSVAIQRGRTGRRYINHRGFSRGGEWYFLWQPPATNQGPLVWYIAALSANGDRTVNGDAVTHLRLLVRPDTASSLSSVRLWGDMLFVSDDVTIHIYSMDGKLLHVYHGKGTYAFPEKGAFILEERTKNGTYFRRLANL